MIIWLGLKIRVGVGVEYLVVDGILQFLKLKADG
jgi:hypothetical protein